MIVQQIKTTIVGILLAIVVVITGGITWGIVSNSYKTDIAKLEKQHADMSAISVRFRQRLKRKPLQQSHE